MTRPLVTCAIPAFNAERYIEATIASVLAQTYSPIEIIIVDDGSTESPAPLLAKYAGRVELIRQTNQGSGAARNTAVRHARGALIAFLDADDLWEPTKIKTQVACFDRDPELQYCVSWMANFLDGDLSPAERAAQPTRQWQANAAFSVDTILARKEIITDGVWFDNRYAYAEDFDWFVRLHERKLKYEVVPEVLVRRRIHASNKSRDHVSSARAMLDVLNAAVRRSRV